MMSVVFYVAVFLAVFVLQSFAVKVKNKIMKKLLILISFLIILLLLGLRYKIGVDYTGYVGLYNSFVGDGFAEIWSHGGDVGTKLIIGTVASSGLDVKIIFWVYGLLTLYPIYKINKNSGFKYLALSTLVFNLTILPACMNIMRQGAAMSFVLLAFDYTRRDSKIVKVLFCLVIATVLHTSALLMLPFLCLYWVCKKINRRFWLWGLVLTTFVSIALITFAKDMFGELGFSDYNYQLIAMTRSMGLYGGAILYNVVYYAMLLFMLFVDSKNKKKININRKSARKRSDLLSLVVDGSVFEFVGSATKNLSRISYYFSIFQVLLIPELLKDIEDKKMRVFVKTVCILILVGLFVFRCYAQGYYGIFPYQTWLFME